ncbi:MAG TPA: hypothetical protein VM534_03925 [Thermoanaerobaculia bacterium]|nr:hypothetical protein [Thermoanaerobaculia bacterium]
MFNVLALVVVILVVSGWATAVVDVHREGGPVEAEGEPLVSRTISSAVLSPSPTSLAFLNEAALRLADPLKGYSGSLTSAIVAPGEPLDMDVPDPAIGPRFTGEKGQVVEGSDFVAPPTPGVWRLAVELDRVQRAIEGFSLITLVPFSEKREGKIGLYYLGSWPYEDGGKHRSPAYANPKGFIRVTEENQNTRVSEHFQLRDFLTKDQPNVWPKYLLLSPKLLDKLELTIQELERGGVEVEHVKIMSGFRTPRYNHSGGNTVGRANLSRHMFGDAADIFIDNDRDGWSDDVTGDGKLTLADAQRIADAADAVERKYPSLVGGIGLYPACCGHGPMVHIDVRGYRARWTY